MSFELTKSLLERLQDDVEEGRDSDILSVVSELHPADIGGVLDRLSPDEARYVLRLLEPETAAEAILELDEDVREKLLEGLTSQEIAEKVI
ncbi:MAG: magnesium transporter, partial [Flavobacteriales bacterium]|nr:magnesium transporter [Flavobacteriales bacterium]